jgi:hypothetical protein
MPASMLSSLPEEQLDLLHISFCGGAAPTKTNPKNLICKKSIKKSTGSEFGFLDVGLNLALRICVSTDVKIGSGSFYQR